MARHEWSREERLLAFYLYCSLPFGRLHKSNKDVISVAEAISRTPSAVAMKACNFASLDPALDRSGLGNVSNADRELWDSFQSDSQEIADEAEKIYEHKVVAEKNDDLNEKREGLYKRHDGPTEAVREVRVRRVQGFFRRCLLVSYNGKCALSGMGISDLLVASHIIPWSVNESRRADPTNGILLNSLYDRAFDEGLITFDEDMCVLISEQLQCELSLNDRVNRMFDVVGQQLMMPDRFLPDAEAIYFHRKNIFKN